MGDLQLLRRQTVPCSQSSALAGLTRGAQLLSSAFAPGNGTKGIEGVSRGPQRRARFGNPPLATKPRAVCKQHARPMERPARHIGPESLLEDRFGCVVLDEERSCIQDPGAQKKGGR